MADNLYHIDDVLIRSGFVLAIAAIVAVVMLSQALQIESPLVQGIALTALLAAPAALLIAGYAVRGRERRLLEIWRILKQHGEMPVDDLRQMSGYGDNELRKAIGLLNRKLAAGLTWDDARRTVRRARLAGSETMTHSQRCGSCGASVSVEVRTRSRPDALRCPYCHGALDGRAISALQDRMLEREAMAKNPQAAPQPVYVSVPGPAPAPRARRFSLLIFILLLMFFWPAAVIYAIHRANNSRTFS